MSFSPCVGDLGTVLYIRVVDREDGAPLDVTGATITGTVTLPDGTAHASSPVTFVASTDVNRPPSDGFCQYTCSKVSSFFTDDPGYWSIQITVANDDGQWKSATPWRFRVHS